MVDEGPDDAPSRANASPLETAAERMTDGLLAFDESYRCTFCNDAAIDILGLEKSDDALDRLATDLFPQSWFEEGEDIESRVNPRGRTEFDRYDRDRDATITVTVDDTGSGATVQLRQRPSRATDHERFRAAMDRSNDAIFIIDVSNLRIADVNETATRRLGYDRDELVGMEPWAVEMTMSGPEECRNHFEAVLEEGAMTLEGFHERRDGSTFPVEVEVSAAEFEEPTEYVVAVARDVTDREERIRDMELLRRLVDAANDAVYVIDHESGGFEYVNETACEMLGYDREEFLEMTPADVDVAFDSLAEYKEHVQSDDPGSGFTTTGEHRRVDGTTIPVEISAKSVEIEDRAYRIATVRDVSEKRARLQRLEEYRNSLDRVNEAATDLITTDSRDLIRGGLVDLSEDLFGDVTVDYLCFYPDDNLLRSEEGCLQEAEHGFPDAVVGPEDHEIWSSFVDTSVLELQDVSRPWFGDDATKTGLVIPVGDDGVLVAVVDGETDISERSAALANLVSAIGRNAFERLEWAERIRRQNEELELANARLSELTQVNEFVRKLQNELLQSTSREEIERVVCDRLETLDDVKLVWIGGYRPGRGRVEPRAWSGSNDTYLDTHDFEVTEGVTEPAVRATVTRSPIVEESIAADRDLDGWHRDALKRGFGSALSVPIRHDNVMYGTLTIFEDSPMSFVDQRELVFAELGETIARAITMVEQRRSLGTDDRIVLEFETEGVPSVVAALAREIEASITIDGIVEQDTESYYLYGEVQEADRTSLTDAIPGLSNLRSVRVLDEGEESLRAEFSVAQQIPPVTILESGGKFHECRATPENCRLRVSFDSGAQINTVIETFTNRHPEWELRVRTTEDASGLREYPVDPGTTLTSRQREILRAALHAGYFTWPRETTGEQLADIFDVTPPTIYRHLRLGLQELVSKSLTE